MYRVICFLFLIILLVSCSLSHLSSTKSEIEKEKLASRILHNVATKLKREANLRPVGTIGQMLHDIEKLGLSFFYYKPIDIAQGRKLLVQSVNALLDAVNQEKRIHTYLCQRPFAPQNIQIEVFIYTSDRKRVSEGNLSVIEVNDGVLRYQVHHPQKNFLTVYEETFDEALERLKDPSLPPVPFKPRTKKITREEWHRVRKGMSFVAGDGTLWHPDENGVWVQDPRSKKSDLRS